MPNVKDASSARARSVPLGCLKKHALVDALLACSMMQYRYTRDVVVDNLRDEIKSSIRRNSIDLVDLHNIVTRCLDYTGGIEELIGVVHLFEGDSIPMNRVFEVVDLSEMDKVPSSKESLSFTEIEPPIDPNKILLTTPLPKTSLIGREQDLVACKDLLTQSNGLAIVGMAGVGKSAFGAALAGELASGDDKRVFWLRFVPGLKTDVDSLLWNLATFLKQRGYDEPWQMLHSERMQLEKAEPLSLDVKLGAIAQGLKEKNLIVCFGDCRYLLKSHNDALASPQDLQAVRAVLKGLTDRAQGYRVIFMSREPLPDLDVPHHSLKGLSSEASGILLSGKGVAWLKERNEELVCYLGGNPQLLRMFAAVLKQENVSQEALLKALDGLGNVQAIANYLAHQFWAHLSQPQRLVLRAVAMFRQEAPEDILTAMFREKAPKALLSALYKEDIVEIKPLLAEMTGTGLLLSDKKKEAESSYPYYKMHELFRTFCYAQIDMDLRNAWHKLVGLRLGASDPLRAAYHCFEANEHSLTFKVLEEHKRDLLKTGNLSNALTQLSRLTRPMFKDHLDCWVEVCELRGEWQQMLGEYEAALDSFGEALGLADRLRMESACKARLYRNLGITRYYQGEIKDPGIEDKYENPLFYLHKAKELLESRQPADEERGITYYWLARVCFRMGRIEDSKEYAQLGLKALDTSQRYSWQLLAYSALAAANARLRDKIACEKALGRAYRLIGEYGLENTVEAALIYNNMGTWYYDNFQYEESVKFSLQAFQVGEKLGLLYRVLRSGYNLGNAYTQLCQLEEAESYMTRSLEESRRVGDIFNEFYALAGLSNIDHRRGDWDSAVRRALSGLEFAEEQSLAPEKIVALSYLGQYHKDMLDEADWQQGLDYLSHAWDILHDPTAGVDTPEFNAELLSAQAEIKARLGQVDDALEDAEQSLVAAEKMQDDYLKGLAYAALGIVFQFRDQRDEAEANFKKAWEILKEDCYEYGRIQLRMGEMYAHFDEYGQATSHLEKAICRFEEINSRRFLAVAKEKLSSLASPGK